MNTELSAFYFDIRKDALYCEAPSSLKRRAALHRASSTSSAASTSWLAPILVFTAEEAWLARYPSEDGSVHLETFPEHPAAWRDDELAEKWEQVRACAASSPARSRSSARPSASARASRPRRRSMSRTRRLARRAGGRRPRRGLHHQQPPRSSPGRRRRTPSRCRTSPASPSCRSARRGQQVRALLAHHDRRRQRPGLSRPVRPRRRRHARDRRARHERLRRCPSSETPPPRGWLWGAYSRLGLAVALATLVLDQAHKWWMLQVYGIADPGPGRGHARSSTSCS